MTNSFNLSLETSELEVRIYREKLNKRGLLTAQGSELTRDWVFAMTSQQGNLKTGTSKL